MEIAHSDATTPSIEAVFACLDEVEILSPPRSNPRGRKRYSTSAMVRSLVMKELLQLSSRRKFAQLLGKHPELAQRCGFSSAPNHSSYAYFIRRMGRDRFVKIVEIIGRKLAESRAFVGRSVVIDATLLSAYSRPHGDRPPSDADAAWGVRSTGDWVFGYKLHLACDAETELPIVFDVTSGNVHDSKMFPILLRRVVELGFHPEWIIADSAYDSDENRQLAASNGIVAVIPQNRRNRKTQTEEPSREWQAIYSQRTSVERVFSRLKEELALKDIRVRSQWRVTVHIAISLLSMMVVALAAIETDHSTEMTKINSFRF
jgi:IS5 family transposase